ncbi:Flp pilus assembly protein CpaB [Phaeovulum sp.]|uniref:Flp pilus assembly protein CpaB n=1 Tax=Phaeovulum sp. TaxID=2934796 RepID=UPI003561A4FF
MRMVYGLVLLVGVALAGVAVYMAQGYIAQAQSERDALLAAQARAPELVRVVVVKRALKYGERFSQADLEVIGVQAGKTPEGIFNAISVPMGTDPAFATVFYDGETRPRAALRSFEAYEPLLASKITAPGVDAGIMANLAPNMRAFTINVDIASGVSGFLRPGDLVDVYWYGQSGQREVTKLIEANLRLIAIDQSADADRSEETKIARTVTAEVSPSQVASLTLAQATGRLTLSLVGNNDTMEVGAIEVDRNSLLGISEEEAVAVEAAKVCTIRSRKAGELVLVEIPCTN